MSIKRLSERFATSKKLSSEGVWIDIDLNDGGKPLRFLLARMGRSNKRWSSQASKVYRHHKRKIDAGLMSDDEATERALKIFCNTVLLDWQNIEDENDIPIPYSPEQGVKILTAFDGLYDYLLEESQDILNYKETATSVLVGNSKPTLAGS